MLIIYMIWEGSMQVVLSVFLCIHCWCYFYALPCFLVEQNFLDWECNSVVEHLPCMHKARVLISGFIMQSNTKQTFACVCLQLEQYLYMHDTKRIAFFRAASHVALSCFWTLTSIRLATQCLNKQMCVGSILEAWCLLAHANGTLLFLQFVIWGINKEHL